MVSPVPAIRAAYRNQLPTLQPISSTAQIGTQPNFTPPIQLKFPKPSPLPDTIPFSVTRDTIVDIPAEDAGKYDVYIDDTITMPPPISQEIPLA